MTKDPLMADVKKHLEGLEFHALLVIPLIFGDEVLGTLCLRAALDHEDIGEREIQLCTAVARASANVLKNVLLHRKVQAESNQRLATSEKLERVFNHSPGLMFVTDADDRITDFNRGAEELLGYSRNEILGQSSAVLTCTEDEEHRRRFTRKDGSELIADFKRIQLLDESGDPTGTLWAGRDLTDLKATQLQLIQAEKLATIGEVISGVAHELNNPLTGVLGYSQLLMARNRDSQTGRELDKISQAAQRCQKIVKNLLSFARADKPNRRLLGINGIIEKTLDLKKYQLHVNNIQVVKNLDPDLPCTTLDFHQIQQVFLNLINNAQHAIAGAGMNPGRIEVTTSHDGDTIQVRMSDNGHGMSPKTLERIFEPFFSTKRDGEGTGLGLSVSYGIVKEHGGTILASSREEEGTTFVLEFPIMAEKDAGAATEQAPSAHVPQAAQPGRILVVDDEPIILDLMIDILAELGHKIDTAENGMEASRKIKNGCYDLVITDVRMPQMDGIELYREIVASRPDLEQKVVFITGDLINTRTVEFLAEIGAPTVPKPLEIGKVTELVEKLLHPSAGSAGGA
jgi:signal transduction histidine kinase/CheY-like chemotaxis protein